MTQTCIATFYKFTPLKRLKALRAELLDFCKSEGIRGTILIGTEGINSTVAGPAMSINALLSHLRKCKEFQGLEAKFSYSNKSPFHRMKVRIKKEIVTLGVTGIDPAKTTGRRVTAAEWNALISNPEVVVLDVRNTYETRVGMFKGSIDPGIKTFRDFPQFVKSNLNPKKNRRIAMFCTGGIRCEKAAAWMLAEGFEEVSQLDGGILKYIEETAEGESLWQGGCFVFDHRVGVDRALAPGGYEMCPSCRWPVTAKDHKHADYEQGVSCPHCRSSLTEKKIASSRERHKQIKLAEARGIKHLG
ncbi:MAG: rhodanese-related sulfurtransferase [Proteobacteria bacterium]|nr:rhodanese-related sulfurtransferase [Pseudomonadota bacterium]